MIYAYVRTRGIERRAIDNLGEEGIYARRAAHFVEEGRPALAPEDPAVRLGQVAEALGQRQILDRGAGFAKRVDEVDLGAAVGGQAGKKATVPEEYKKQVYTQAERNLHGIVHGGEARQHRETARSAQPWPGR